MTNTIQSGYPTSIIAALKQVVAKSDDLEMKIKMWLNNPDYTYLSQIPQMEGSQRTQSLTRIKQDAVQAQGDKVLLYRGGSLWHYDENVANNKYRSKWRSSWTLNKNVAVHFAKDRVCQGIVFTGWVNTKDIVAIPLHLLKNTYEELEDEYEVIVEKNAIIKLTSFEMVEVYTGNENHKACQTEEFKKLQDKITTLLK